MGTPEEFPSMDSRIYFSHLLSPYWSDIDTRRAGRVRYETYTRGDMDASDRQITMVTDFLAAEEVVNMTGEWMLLASWEDVHPFPHGLSSTEQERVNPHLELVMQLQWNL